MFVSRVSILNVWCRNVRMCDKDQMTCTVMYIAYTHKMPRQCAYKPLPCNCLSHNSQNTLQQHWIATSTHWYQLYRQASMGSGGLVKDVYTKEEVMHAQPCFANAHHDIYISQPLVHRWRSWLELNGTTKSQCHSFVCWFLNSWKLLARHSHLYQNNCHIIPHQIQQSGGKWSDDHQGESSPNQADNWGWQ